MKSGIIPVLSAVIRLKKLRKAHPIMATVAVYGVVTLKGMNLLTKNL